MNLKQKVVSGLAWSGAGRLIAQITTWAITIVIIRLLSPEDYGLLALATVFIGLLTLINEMGLGAGIVQNKDVDLPILKSLFGLIIFFSFVFYLFLYLSAPYIADFFSEPRLVLIIRILGVEFIINGFSVIPRSLLIRQMKFRPMAIVEFASSVAGSVVTLVLALLGYGVWSLVLGILLMRIVSTIGFNLSQPFIHLPSTSMKGMKVFFAIGGSVTVCRILWYFYSQADTLIIGKVLGKDLLGFYSIGLMLAQIPMDKVMGIVNQVAFPAFSSVQTDIELVARHFLKAIRSMSFIMIPVLWGISSISPEIVNIFLGDKWVQAALPMQIIAIIVPLRMITTVMGNAILGVGRYDVCLYQVLIPVIVLPIAFFIGSNWGIVGVSLAWLLAFPIVFLLQVALTIKILKISFMAVIGAMLMPCAAGLVMYGVVTSMRYLNVLSINLITEMVFLIFCGATSYILITLIINRSGLQEVMNLFKK